MSDPLSIASGIAGLISLAGKLVSVLNDLYNNTQDAPSFATSLTSEILALRVVFQAVQKLVDQETGELDESRLSMISINDLRLALMGCICVFGTLEKEVLQTGVFVRGNRLVRFGQQGASSLSASTVKPVYEGADSWDRFVFAGKTPMFKGILEDLQRHKMTLNLMLNIIHCETSSEALRKAEELKRSVEQVIRSHTMTAKQLQFLMAREGPPSDTISQLGDSSSSIISNMQSVLSIPLRSFETILKRTRVYRHGYVWNTSSLSLGSSVMKRTRWTTMSDLSLSDISNMAVIDLPIWPQDVWNAEYYTSNSKPDDALTSQSDETHESVAPEAGPSTESNIPSPPPTPPPPSISSSSEPKGQKQLLYAIVDCDIEEVTSIIESGIPLDIGDDTGQGPLNWAVQTGCLDMAQLLINKGADVNAAQSHLFFTPLHSAISVDAADMVELLIEKGAKIESLDHLGRTPLAYTAVRDSVNCARVLLDKGANIKTRAGQKLQKATPLHLAAQQDAVEVARLLLERGADPKAKDKNLRTPKMAAMIMGNKKALEVLDKYSQKGKGGAV